MRRRWLVALIASALVAVAACSDDGRSSNETGGGGTDEPAESSESATIAEFGDLAFPCGPNEQGGELPADPDGTFGITDAGIGVTTFSDPGYEAIPGLNQELFDAAETFAAECNEAGGINGRPIDLHLRDAALFEYPARVDEACAEDFAVVGGGAALDDGGAQTLTDCGMPSIPGYAVTAAASLADNVVQAVPNPPNVKPASSLVHVLDQLDEDGAGTGLSTDDVIKNAGIIYADIATTADVADQFRKTAEELGFEFVYEASYNVLGEANWQPFAQAIADAGVEFLSYTGTYEFLVQLQEAMDTVGAAPAIIFEETNLYDQDYAAGIAGLNPDTVNLVRSAYWPFEYADANPATQTYLDLLEEHVPGAVPAQLGLQAFSAWLLFAQSAAECDRNNDLTRTCVLETARTVDSWTGGGLHAETNPAEFSPPVCNVSLQVVDGTFTIWRAEGETPEDAYFCPEEDAVIEIDGNYGEGVVRGGS